MTPRQRILFWKRRADQAGRGRLRDGSEEAPLERKLSVVMVAALGLALALLLGGAVLAGLRGGGEDLSRITIQALPHLLAGGEVTGVLGVGLLVVLAVPAVRTAVLLVAFALRREWLFAALCAVVLAVLAAGVLTGLRAW